MNFKAYPESIWTLINRKGFFRRFNNLPKGSDKLALYENILSKASVELYERG